MTDTKPLYGLLAEFDNPSRLVEAFRGARGEGYYRIEVFSPFPIATAPAVGRRTGTALFVLSALLVGAAVGFLVRYATGVATYPLELGATATAGWPSYAVAGFQVALLLASLTALYVAFSMRLPGSHPLFNLPEFEQARQTRFFLCVRSTGSRFDPEAAARVLAGFRPLAVWEVPIEE